MTEDERLYMIYDDTRDGLKYVDDEIAKNPKEALKQAFNQGFVESGRQFTVIAESNMNDVMVR